MRMGCLERNHVKLINDLGIYDISKQKHMVTQIPEQKRCPPLGENVPPQQPDHLAMGAW